MGKTTLRFIAQGQLIRGKGEVTVLDTAGRYCDCCTVGTSERNNSQRKKK